MAKTTLTVPEILELITDQWEEATGESVDNNDIAKQFKAAVIHVETLDFPEGADYSVKNDGIEFNDPAVPIRSAMLYVYKTLMNMHKAYVNKKVSSNQLGVSWRSGMESISTSTAGKISEQTLADFRDEYEKALRKAKISKLGPTSIDLYSTT